MENNKKKMGIRVKLLALAILPALIVVFVVILFARQSLTDGLSSQSLDGLKLLAEAVNAGYGNMDGDFSLDAENNLWKGDTNLTANIDMIDNYVAGSDAEVTIFIGKTRRLTTLVGRATGERSVGTDGTDEVWSAVQSGKT